MLRVEQPGGDGVGLAFERNPEAVRQGYVSVARARGDYGLALRDREDGAALDWAATRELRSQSPHAEVSVGPWRPARFPQTTTGLGQGNFGNGHTSDPARSPTSGQQERST